MSNTNGQPRVIPPGTTPEPDPDPTKVTQDEFVAQPGSLLGKAKIAQIDLRGENLGRRCRLDLGLVGDVNATIEALLPRLQPRTNRIHLDESLANYQRARRGLDDLAKKAESLGAKL